MYITAEGRTILWHAEPLLGNGKVQKHATNTQPTIENVQCYAMYVSSMDPLKFIGGSY
jgi:hypothetical protein